MTTVPPGARPSGDASAQNDVFQLKRHAGFAEGGDKHAQDSKEVDHDGDRKRESAQIAEII